MTARGEYVPPGCEPGDQVNVSDAEEKPSPGWVESVLDRNGMYLSGVPQHLFGPLAESWPKFARATSTLIYNLCEPTLTDLGSRYACFAVGSDRAMSKLLS